MKIGSIIRKLRLQSGITQEQLSNALAVSVQTISRWETSANYPDLEMLPLIARYFRVTTDYLLGIEGGNNNMKLLKTVETFEVPSREEAESLVKKFSSEKFPVLLGHKITENDDGAIILEVEKKFGVNLEDMPWKANQD
ncbi:helix-turn-helix domain-containing protein [Paenibacillus cellulositrophicus]|uniref:helix-turn-helix domain-containing protein n=1 Tax=Paenibacillus cellulositrophicus TaxID=562959 RepID=UPI003D96CD4B